MAVAPHRILARARAALLYSLNTTTQNCTPLFLLKNGLTYVHVLNVYFTHTPKIPRKRVAANNYAAALGLAGGGTPPALLLLNNLAITALAGPWPAAPPPPPDPATFAETIVR